MKCVLCGGALQNKVVDEEVRVENNHYLVKMKVEVCRDCGERYYQDGQIDELIQLTSSFNGKENSNQEETNIEKLERCIR